MNADASFGLAVALARGGQIADGRNVAARIRKELTKRELLSSPAMTPFHIVLSMLAMNEGELMEASAECDSAMEYSTVFARRGVFRQKAEVLLREKAFEQAIEACEQGLSGNRNNPDILLTLVRIYSVKGDSELAKTIGQRLLDLWKDADPDFIDKAEILRILPK